VLADLRGWLWDLFYIELEVMLESWSQVQEKNHKTPLTDQPLEEQHSRLLLHFLGLV